jgi:hypothetical protein
MQGCEKAQDANPQRRVERIDERHGAHVQGNVAILPREFASDFLKQRRRYA